MRRDFHITDKPVIMIIPMIDIMLFLLVFFMISTLYMVQLNSLSVNLPAAAASQRETQAGFGVYHRIGQRVCFV
jgi:biopolymer transport protein ExbD